MEINIKVDSRKVKNGDIFVALRGVSSDGHDYIDKAIENGACKLIVEEDKNYSISYEVVKDTKEYLINYLKENYYKYLENIKIIGFTGTNGKTTSAFLLHSALNMLGLKASYIGTVGFYASAKIESLNNTTPDILDLYNLLLKSYELGCKYIVMEVSSQGLSYKRVEGIDFDYAIFTNLTQDHLDYHLTMENYCDAKKELFRKLKNNGKAIINYDDGYKENFILKENINITYGFNGGDYHIKKYNMTNTGTSIEYEYKDKTYKITTPLIGKYNIYNLLTTLVVLNEEGIKQETINELIPNLKAPLGRMETIKKGSNSIIIDYAHTPDAIEKIIKTMKDITKGNIYVVFGCTGDRDRTKRPIMTNIVTSLSNKAIITIDDLHNEDPKQIVEDMLDGITNRNYEVILDRKQAIKKGISYLRENDSLLILGKGHEEFIIIKDNKIPFQDREVVLEILEEENIAI